MYVLRRFPGGSITVRAQIVLIVVVVTVHFPTAFSKLPFLEAYFTVQRIGGNLLFFAATFAKEVPVFHSIHQL